MTFPSVTVAPSVVTEFVNGIKFDICEVIPEAYSQLTDKKFRYFLAVEDTFIVNYSAAERYFESTKEVRWDLFCTTKGECLSMIKDYENKCVQIGKWQDMIQQKTGISGMLLPKISALNESSLNKYGVKPVIL